MFKKPGGGVGCARDMGNASERRDGSERYDDAGDPEGPVGRRGPGFDTLFTVGVGGGGASGSVMMTHGAG